MTNEQLRYIIDNKLIKENIEEMSFMVLPKTNTYILQSIEDLGDNVYFIVKNPALSKCYRINAKYLDGISGMTIDRFLESQLINDKINIIEIDEKTDISKIIGETSGTLNNIELKDGMKIILHNDKVKNNNDKVLTIKGVGESIKFSAGRGRPKKVNKK